MANISHRIGKIASPDIIRERIGQQAELKDAVERCAEYLRANGVDLNSSSAVLGPWVNWDNEHQKFTGEFADAANQLMHPAQRKPFEVPEIA
jgi:hypothetical protein